MTDLFSQYHNWTPRITDEEIASFLQTNLGRVGSETMITPREIIRDYMTVLNILLQNDDVTFADILKKNSQQTPPPDESGEKPTRKISAEDIKF